MQIRYDTVDQSQVTHVNATKDGITTAYDKTNSELGLVGITFQGRRAELARDPDGNPIADRDRNGTMRYYLTDYQGSVRAHTDGVGFPTYFNYTPWGKIESIQGPDGAPDNNVLHFTGMSRAENEHYYHAGVRGYDAFTGRFTQPDPLGGLPGQAGPGEPPPYSADVNPYANTNANPCNETDRTGFFSVGCAASALNPFAIGTSSGGTVFYAGVSAVALGGRVLAAAAVTGLGIVVGGVLIGVGYGLIGGRLVGVYNECS